MLGFGAENCTANLTADLEHVAQSGPRCRFLCSLGALSALRKLHHKLLVLLLALKIFVLDALSRIFHHLARRLLNGQLVEEHLTPTDGAAPRHRLGCLPLLGPCVCNSSPPLRGSIRLKPCALCIPKSELPHLLPGLQVAKHRLVLFGHHGLGLATVARIVGTGPGCRCDGGNNPLQSVGHGSYPLVVDFQGYAPVDDSRAVNGR